jgi:hypothetical protein
MAHGIWDAWFRDKFGLPDHRKPRVGIFHCAARPIIGRDTTVRLRLLYAELGHLTGRHEDGAVAFDGDVSSDCQVSIVALNATPITFTLRAEPKRASCACVPFSINEWKRLPRPETLTFWWAWVPWFAFLGKPICIRWKCPKAEWVDIIRDDGYKSVVQKGGKSGIMTFFPDAQGKITVRFIARNSHGSVTEITRLVRVFPVKPRLIVERATQYVTPGNMVTFSWTANTPDVWLEAPSRNERHVLEQTGRFSMPMGDEPEEFFLKARRLDKTCSVTLSAIPV